MLKYKVRKCSLSIDLKSILRIELFYLLLIYKLIINVYCVLIVYYWIMISTFKEVYLLLVMNYLILFELIGFVLFYCISNIYETLFVKSINNC